MKSSSDLKEARNSSPYRDSAIRWFGDATQNLEQRALAGPVTANDADDFALFDFRTYIFECPEFFDLIALYHLASANEIGSFAREVSNLAAGDVTQRRPVVDPIPSRGGGSVPNQIPFG